jgi:hypothetical protein
MMRYLNDFAWTFVTLIGPFVNVLAGGIVVMGMMIVIGWATIPHIARRL